jgi:CelD/BcsL family acetyltransferase involved in cellulose biosynthesis/RimJ/RimL family protein N-acetyltransferase
MKYVRARVREQMTTTGALSLEIHRGDSALELIARSEFRDAWRSLHRGCPWSTAFQDIPFTEIWYRCYRTRFAPVIVAGWTDARLIGLFLLAVSHDGTTLCHAGEHHAEYQVWLSTDDRFVAAALDMLADEFPGRKLQLAFVPPGVAFTPRGRWRNRCFRRPIRAPLLATNPADSVRQSIANKSTKNKFNRLAREGKLTFGRVSDDAAFATLFDEMIPLYDLRHGAAHDVLPFRQDELKKPFHLALKRETDLLDVTVMRADDTLIAAHVGIRSRNTVLVALAAQSPRYGRQSAGKLLFLELALLLEQEGVDVLDLTPGGEYKDHRATHFKQASTLTILFSAAAAWRFRQQRRLIDAAKRVGVSTDSTKRLVRGVRHTLAHLRPADLPLKAVRRLKCAAWGDVELRIYRFPRGRPVTHPETVRIARDRFQDLACYEPVERWQPTTTAFLQRATKRLENGEHCYTYVEDGVLAQCGWLVDRQQSTFMNEVHQTWTLPVGSAVAYDFYTDPRFRGRGMYSSSLGRMVRDAEAIPGCGQLYIGVRGDNAASRRVIEKIGFEYERSFFEQRRLGAVRQWSAISGEPAPS